MPKIVDVEEMKHQIMTEAVHVFIRRGYHSTTFAEIARRCGIGRTTIYQYFKNKEEIFIYAVKHINQVFEAEYKSILEDNRLDVLEKIKRIFSKFMMRCCKKNNEITLLIELGLILKRDNHELLEQVIKSVELQDVFYKLLEEGARANQITLCQYLAGKFPHSRKHFSNTAGSCLPVVLNHILIPFNCRSSTIKDSHPKTITPNF